MLKRKDERSANDEKDETYLPRDGIINTVDEMECAFDHLLRRITAASFASVLVELFKENMIKLLLVLLQKVAAQYGENIPKSEV